MVLWGLTSAATMFVSTPLQFYTVRFLLGVFEAGFFPGIILYLTYWFPSSRRGRVTGQFMFAIPVAGIVGGPLSGWIMSHMDGVWGWGGWQWMFLLEGLPTCFLGIACFFLLTDSPKNAKWLTEREKTVVETVLNADQGEDRATGHATAGAEIKRAFGDARVWILAFVYFATACANYTFTFWLPTMVKSLGVTDVSQIGWYTFFPYVSAALGILLISWNSDRLMERRWHVAGSLIIAAIALSSTTLLSSSLWLTLAVMCIVGFFQFGAGILYWAIPPTYLRKDQAAVGIALISSLGVIGGFVSPTLLGLIKTYTGSLDNGIYVVAGIMIAGAVVTLTCLPSRALRVGKVPRDAPSGWKRLSASVPGAAGHTQPPRLAQRNDFPPNPMCDRGRSSTSTCTDHRCSVRNSITPAAAADLVPDGATVMIGGFMGVGSPNRIIDALVSRGARKLTVIANDTARPGVGIGKLITAGAVSRVIVSHIGTNPETQQKMLAGDIDVELIPQGTLAERIRAGGAGLGGVLTATGVGTVVAEGKKVVTIEGRDFLIETALNAQIALVAARSADYAGNLVYSLTARNFNPLMVMAAATVIAESNEIVPVGVLAPDVIHSPGVLVDHLIARPQPR